VSEGEGLGVDLGHGGNATAWTRERPWLVL